MKKLELHHGNLLQGDFQIKKLNMLLVFQVNCPGCFSYALPFFNKLFNEFKADDVSFLGLSSAFESFNNNSLQNTVKLIEEGALVGSVKTIMQKEGYNKLPYTLDFPIAIDVMEAELTDMDYAINKICNTNPNYNLWPDYEQKDYKKRVKNYLFSLEKVALTFTLNQLKGSPSFVLFNNDYEILGEWFGHTRYEQIASKIKSYI